MKCQASKHDFTQKKRTFLTKKALFCFAVQKKAVPLHPQSKVMVQRLPNGAAG